MPKRALTIGALTAWWKGAAARQPSDMERSANERIHGGWYDDSVYCRNEPQDTEMRPPDAEIERIRRELKDVATLSHRCDRLQAEIERLRERNSELEKFACAAAAEIERLRAELKRLTVSAA